MRFFNTAGPVHPEKHYCVPPLERIDTKEIEMLIDQEKYFLLHAPQQTGKTSCMIALRDHLNDNGTTHALYCNVESAQGARENVYRGIKSILAEIARAAQLALGNTFPYDHCFEILEKEGKGICLGDVIRLDVERFVV